MKPIIESGVKDLHVVKTTKATFLGFYNDEYRTAPELFDRVLWCVENSIEGIRNYWNSLQH
jgi:urate oxidase